MSQSIQTEIIGHLGVITLNRPAALNALNTDMCTAMTKVMLDWRDDDAIAAVLVKGAGDRAFCAGGDVIMLHDSGKKDGAEAEAFWRIEYALDDLIQRYPKPYIALIDGIVMGGGVGLSVHGEHRIAGDTTLFAMPETGIGYFPDVGGSYFLPRLGTAIGMWLGLTGARVKTPDICALGIATAYVPSDKHGKLIAELATLDPEGAKAQVTKIIAANAQQTPQSQSDLSGVAAFEGGTVAQIMQDLKADGSDWASKQLSILKSKSPLALAVTHKALSEGAQLSFRDAMSRELDISLNFLKTQDFYEGIRAQLIDKDRNPKWSHEAFSDVTDAQTERLFKTSANPPLQFLD